MAKNKQQRGLHLPRRRFSTGRYPSFNTSRIERLESRWMLSSTPIDLQVSSDDQLVSDSPMMVVNSGPVEPAWLSEMMIQWGSTESIEEAIDSEVACLPAEEVYLRDSEIEPDWLVSSIPTENSVSIEAMFPLSETFKLHSKPDSSFTIYLDFDGHTTVGTTWNTQYGVTTIESPAYDTDGDPSTFSNSELQRIQDVWEIVAEDFAPFDVNVTTEDPGSEALRKSGTGDSQWGARVVITDDTFADCGCGGHAYIGAFEDPLDEPGFVYNTSLLGVAEAASHEVGHMLNLAHDGLTDGTTYYGGHGSGVTKWGPIMGASYSVAVSQWDFGEYYNANNNTSSANYSNGKDDLDVITTTNGFTFRADDHGNGISTATLLNSGGESSFSGSGIIERNTDLDVFAFTTTGGVGSFQFQSPSSRPNLDIWAGIYDSNGNLVAQSNPSNNLSASLNDILLEAGTYYLKVDGVGSHGVYNPITDKVEDPSSPPWLTSSPVGYSQYGSLGQYVLTGSIVEASNVLLSVADVSVLEGNTATIVISLSEPTTDVIQVTVKTLSGTADQTDFTSLNQVISIPANSTSYSFQLPTVEDVEVESDETFAVELSNAVNATIDDGLAIVTIQNDDAGLQIFSLAASKDESDSGTTDFTFTIARTGNTSGATTFNYQVLGSGVNPASANDFGGTFPSGTLSFGLGETSKLLTISVSGDSQVEADELFKVLLSNPTADTSILVAEAEGVILNDDAELLLAPTLISQSEGNSGTTIYQYTVTRLGDPRQLIELNYSVSGLGVSQASAEDFAAGVLPSGSLTLLPDHMSGNIDILVASDSTVEADEGFSLNVTVVTAGIPIDKTTVDGQIANDDAAIGFVVPAQSYAESDNDTEVVVILQRSGDMSVSHNVDYAFNGGDADAADFGGIIPSGTITFAPGEDSQVIRITLASDNNVELDESFELKLSGPSTGATLSNSIFTGTILNDDTSIEIVPVNSQKQEGEGSSTSLTFIVNRTGNLTSTSNIRFDVLSDGIAGATASDFVGNALPSGQLTFAPGETQKQIDIKVQDDSEVEEDESFIVELSEPSSDVTISTDQAIGLIINDDAAFSITPLTNEAAEGDQGLTPLTFLVTRSGAVSAIASVDFAVSIETNDTADAVDFGGSLPQGSVLFNANESQRTITIDVQGDDEVETNETFTITLSNPSLGHVIETAVSGGIINNDDIGVRIEAVISGVSEGSIFAYRIVRTGDSTQTTTIQYAAQGSGASPVDAADFGGTLPSGQVVFTPGQTSKLVTFSSSQDLLVEADETFTISITGDGSFVISTGSLTGTIFNDDTSTQFAPLDVNEDGTVDASTDGNLILTVMFGLPDSNLTPFRGSSVLTEAQISNNVAALISDNTLDVNESGNVDASTDGNLILAVLFGFAPQNLTPLRGNTSLTNEQIFANVNSLTIVPQASLTTLEGESIGYAKPQDELDSPSYAIREPLSDNALNQISDTNLPDKLLTNRSLVEELIFDEAISNSVIQLLFGDWDNFSQRLALDESELYELSLDLLGLDDTETTAN
ncbi:MULTISPECIES: Calx-beta domain-containing protein [Pirellulaceae]|uniref:Calx-beta domain-containing protein n=1 Tax=Pirellulaceae TaxID=2691357 RepID=UPI0013050157|nr:MULTISPECIES: Calx-beta domain-containing protein [Pirellulaceae]